MVVLVRNADGLIYQMYTGANKVIIASDRIHFYADKMFLWDTNSVIEEIKVDPQTSVGLIHIPGRTVEIHP